MDNELEEKRITLFRNASDETRQLYGNPELGKTLGDIINELKLPEEKHKTFIDVIGDIILGIDAKENFKELLKSKVALKEETALRIATTLGRFLENMPDPKKGKTVNYTVLERLVLRPDEVRSESGVGYGAEATEPNVVPEVRATVKPAEVPAPQAPAAEGPDAIKVITPIAPSEATQPIPKTLTRDELMKALSAKRTMASDMLAAQQSKSTGPVHGYAAMKAQEEEAK